MLIIWQSRYFLKRNSVRASVSMTERDKQSINIGPFSQEFYPQIDRGRSSDVCRGCYMRLVRFESLRGQLSHDRVREGPLRDRTNRTEVELDPWVKISRETMNKSQ